MLNLSSAGSSKIAVLSILTLSLTLAACSSDSSPKSEKESMEILNQVSEVYSNLDQYHFEAQITTNISADGQNQTIEMPITYAADKPGKLHMNVKGENYRMQMISNGTVTWTYMPDKNEYTKKQASSLTPESAGEGGAQQNRDVEALAQELTGQYSDITDRIKSSELLRTETIKIGDSTHETYVIKADYNPPVDMPTNNTKMSPTTFWIDQDRYIVVKQRFEVEMQSPRFNDPVLMEQVTEISSVTVDEAPEESLFAFNPPEDAKEVQEFTNTRQPSSQDSELEGSSAMNFELPSLAGNKVELEEYKGQVVLLDFWATWCAPCRRAHPHIQSVHEEFKDEGLKVLGINNENERTAREYMNENNYTFTTLLDLNNKVGNDYNVNAIPSVYIIDRQGNISSHLLGYQPESKLRKALKEAGI